MIIPGWLVNVPFTYTVSFGFGGGADSVDAQELLMVLHAGVISGNAWRTICGAGVESRLAICKTNSLPAFLSLKSQTLFGCGHFT